MTLPTDAFGVAVLVLLVIPGTVYSAVRTRVSGRGPYDGELGSRILRAIIASVVFGSIYLVVFGSRAVELLSVEELTRRPRMVAVAVVVLGIVIPAIAGYVLNGRPRVVRGRVSWMPRLPTLETTTGHERALTAWDWAAERTGGTFVRIRLDDGTWVGGWYGPNSFVSTYPETRDIYVQVQYAVAADGTFGDRIEGSRGFWLSVPPSAIVEWVEAPRTGAEG